MRVEIRVSRKTFIMRSMISLSLFKNYLIIVIIRSIYCRYSMLILLSLPDFDFHENRNSCFFKYIFIMRSRISLLLFNVYYTFDNLIVVIRCSPHLPDARLAIVTRF